MEHIVGHFLVGGEVCTFKPAVYAFNLDVDRRVDFVRNLIPVEQFGIESVAPLVADKYVAFQFPQLFLVVEVGCIGLNARVYMEFLIEFLKVEPFFETPFRRIGLVVDIPFFGYDFLSYHAAV